MIPVGDSTSWRTRITQATDDELATLDQQIGPTHALRALISDEVTSRARRRAGVGAEFEPVAIPSAAGIATTPPPAPTLDPVSVPPVPAANPAAPQASAPVAVPPFYTEGDQQTARDTVNTMDTAGRIGGEVINDYRKAAGDVLTEYSGYAGDVLSGWSDAAQSTINEWLPRISSAYDSVSTDIGNAASSGYDLAKQAVTQTGFPAPAGDSMLGAQIKPNTPSTGTMMNAEIGPRGAPIGSPAAAATVPGGPPPPSPPSPLSHVSAVPAPKRKPTIPVALPPEQTTKSANDPSAAEALNRFYAGQYSQGRMPGAPASSADGDAMARMGGLTGPYR